MDDDSVRLARAREKMSREDAFLLRATAHGWLKVDELTVIGPAPLARQILAALDAVSVLHGTEAETAATDAALRRIDQGLFDDVTGSDNGSSPPSEGDDNG